MKTVRFTEVVKRSGSPEVHLLLTKPSQDPSLQKAIKAHRVMTVLQEATGAHTDSGTIGFEEGPSRQYWVFPKSLQPFASRRVVGIKYDLLSSRELPKSQRADPPKPPPKKKKPLPKPVLKPAPTPAPKLKEPAPRPPKSQVPRKVVQFHPPEREDAPPSADVRRLKRLARQAMEALEQGKQVQAFNLLKRIVTA